MPARRTGSLRSAKGFFLVLSTVSSEREARRLARRLVQAREAACVNVVPRLQSHYWWKGRVESAREALLLIKTTAGRLPSLVRRLHRWHSYEVPELLVLSLRSGSRGYLDWLNASVPRGKSP